MQEYLTKLEGPIVNQVWGRLVSLLKDITANTQAHRSQVFPSLKYVLLTSDHPNLTP
jgi:hypothetical protein